MSSFTGVVTGQADVGLRFCLQIQGIPYLLLDGPEPVGPSGSTWASPTSKTHPYTMLPDTLDLSDGLIDPGSRVSRSSGDSQPSQLTVTLRDNRAQDLLGILARERSDGHTANLTASFGYDSGAPPAVMTVDDTTGWDVLGFLYFGRETIYYGAVPSGSTFGTLTRDVFSIGDADTLYRHNAEIPHSPRVVSSYPRTWHGRYMRLFAFVVGLDGTAYDTGYGGTYSQEIWRGIIVGNPRPLPDWTRWELRCESIETILETQVGRDSIKGALLRLPLGSVAAQEAGDFGDGVPGDAQPMSWVDDNTRLLEMVVREWTTQAAKNAGAAPNLVVSYTGDNALAVTGAGAPKLMSRGAWVGQIGTTWAAQVAGDTSALTMWYGVYGGAWAITFSSDGTYVYEIDVLFGSQGSCGPLLGFVASETVELSGFAVLKPSGPPLVAYIPATQQVPTIPFWYQETSGAVTDTPSAPGYARIGDGDTAEIIHYTSIGTPTTPYTTGLKLLEGVTRGAMHTPIREIKIQMTADYKASGDKIEVVFGVGFEGTSFLSAILQLATSTGDGHHGAYDLLGDRVSPPLNPNHFDLEGWADIDAQLFAGQAHIGYFLSETAKLRELVSEWLRPHGLYVRAGRRGGAYQILVDRVLPPLESAAQVAVGAGDLDITDPATWADGLDRIINELTIYPQWDAAAEEARDTKVTLTADDAVSEYGTRGALEWTLRGYDLPFGTAYVLAAIWGHRLFARYGRPYDLFELHLGRSGLGIEIGDVLTLTVAGAPDASGARGITDRDAVVLSVSKRWAIGEGTDDSTGADVLVVLEPTTRQSTYSPSARVSSYAAGGPSVTLQTNGYSAQGADADHLAVGDVVRIYSEGDVSTIDERTIIGIAGNVVTLSAALVNALPVSATDTILVAADYTSVQLGQTAHAFVANNATPPAVGADGAFHWV